MPVPRSLARARYAAAALAVGAALLVTGCGASTIPNTDVQSTPRKRRVIDFAEKYRHAVERQDVGTLLKLASGDYLDDNGTPTGTDDIDYERLRQTLSEWERRVLDVRYECRYRRVTFRRGHILVDYTYTASFRVETPEGDRWARRLADNRMVLVKKGEEGPFRILSGM